MNRFSIIAAVDDKRFPKITAKELNDTLRLDISLLDKFEEINDCMDWKIGTHGLDIEFFGPVGSG